MRIVQLVTNLEIGGMERLVVDLAECQLREGHQPFIYCLTHEGGLAASARSIGITVHPFQKPAGPQLATVYAMARQLRQDRPDVLHTHNHLVHHYGVAAGILARVPRIVNTRHGVERRFIESPEGLQITTEPKDRKADLLFRATLPWVDSVVMVSEATRRFFVDYRNLPGAKTTVILNGAHLEAFLANPAHPGSLRPRIRFGTAARLVREKDPRTLLRAFATALVQIPEAELWIAGDGPLRSSMEGWTQELNIGRAVRFLGSLPSTSEFLSKLDIFVLTSLTEGMPVSILEAMAAGLPIVSTRVGGVEEAAVEGQNAFLAEAGDVTGLANAMIRMAHSENLAEMGAIGRQVVQREFTIENTWQGYRRLFTALCRAS